MGERIIALHKIKNNDTGEVECHKKKEGRLYMMYCNQTTLYDNSDWCQYLEDSAVVYKAGIPGLGSGVFSSKFSIWLLFEFSEVFQCHSLLLLFVASFIYECRN